MTKYLWFLMLAFLPAAQDELKPGIVAEYFAIGEEMDDFPTLGDRKPSLRRLEDQVNYESADGEFAASKLFDYFYVSWTGILRVPEDGIYVFATESDDGSRLFMDGKLVVDNGGIHGMQVMSGRVELKKGDHDIRIGFFDNDRGAGCKASWAMTGTELDVIPPRALFHRADKELDK